MLPSIQYSQAMPIRAWIPVESLDDDLLTLESAAVLALMAKHRTSELSIAIKKWQLIEASLGGNIQEPTGLEGAVIALRNLLESTGLALPSTLKVSRKASFDAALTEMSGLVQGPLQGRNSPQAAVALLNLACEESLVRTERLLMLLQSKLLSRAWNQIYLFASSIKPKPGSPPRPQLRGPVPAEWKSHDPDLVGDSTPWSIGIGPMFHTLAGWDSTWLMGNGTMMRDELWNSIRYWTPLPHLALALLGWSDPAVGSARWILMGMPKETPELSLLSRVWGPDALMYFAHPQMDWVAHEFLGFELRTSGRHISRIYEELGNAKAFSDCGSLHMHVHLQWQLGIGNNQPAGNSHLYSSTKGRPPRFVLELEKLAGWHSQLYLAGDNLPVLPNGEVVMTVVAPPVGPLGTFKRSRTTGLWYVGSHDAHLLGHSDLNGPLRRVPSTMGFPANSQPLVQTPSDRHTSAIAFWLASELARRHPHYVLHGEGPDELTLVSAAAPTIHISRCAAVSVGGRELVGTSELFAADDKRGLIGDLEESIGLPVRKHAAPTTERTLIYRTMAHIAALLISDKGTWDLIAVKSKEPVDAWQLNSDGEPVALLMPDGYVRIADRTINLLERYHFHGRRMTSMVGEVFGAVLP